MIYNLGKALNFSLCGISRLSKAGVKTAGIWNHLRLPICLMIRVSSCLGPQLGLSARTYVHDLSMWLLGLPHHMMAKFQEQAPQENQVEGALSLIT